MKLKKTLAGLAVGAIALIGLVAVPSAALADEATSEAPPAVVAEEAALVEDTGPAPDEAALAEDTGPASDEAASVQGSAPAEATASAGVAPAQELVPIEEPPVDHGEPPMPLVEIVYGTPVVDCGARTQTVQVITSTTPVIWSDDEDGWILGAPLPPVVTYETTPAYDWQCDIEVTLATPYVEDSCGTDQDYAYLPASTDGVTYYWASEDPSNYDVVAIVNSGYVVNVLPAGWVLYEQEEGDVYVYVWNPTWTDVPCDGGNEDVVTTLSDPYIEDACGTENDVAVLPDDTEGVVYSWYYQGPEFYTAKAALNKGFVLDGVPEGWAHGMLLNEYLYNWVPGWTDVPCAVTPPSTEQPPVVTPPAPEPAGHITATTTPATLAATGGSQVGPMVPIGGGLALLLGAVLAMIGPVRRARA